MSGDKLHCSTCNLNDLSKLHLLPCLHASCKDCLLDALMCCDGIKSNAQQLSEDKDTKVETSAKPASGNLDRVFSCPKCSYKILLSKSVIDGLVSLDSAILTQSTALSKDDKNLKTVHCSTCGQDLDCSQNSNQSDSRQSNSTSLHKSNALFCATCDLSLCKSCVSADGPGAEHSAHTVCSLDDILQGRRRQLTRLTAQARGSAEEMSRRLNSLKSAQSHLDETKHQILRLLDLRTEELCNLIVSRRDALARELTKEHENCAVQYGHDTVASKGLEQNLHDALHFTSTTFSSQEASTDNIADQNSYISSDLCTTLSGLFSPVSSRLNDLVNTSGGRTAGGMGVTNLQLTAHGSMYGPWEVKLPVADTTSPYSISETKSSHLPDNPKQSQSIQINNAEVAQESALLNQLSLKAHPDDVAGIEKLFGSLVRGVVCCGGPQRVMTHSVNLTWPVALVITRSHDFVVAGKTGAFASEGKLMFYDRYANLISTHPYGKNRLPISMVTTSNGRVLVSDTSGSISKLSSCGKLLEEWAGKFKVGKQSLEDCQQKSALSPRSSNMDCKETSLTPGGDRLNESSDCKSLSSGETCGRDKEESVPSIVKLQGGGEGGGGGVSVVGGKIVGGHMAVGPDGCVWVSSGCGRLIKYSTVDGHEVESLNLWRRVKFGSVSNIMLNHKDKNDDNVSNDDNSVNNFEGNGDTLQVKPETVRQSAELNNCSDLLKAEVASVRQIRKREESGHVQENEKDMKLFSKQTLSLDINSLAMDSNGCFVVCVQDQKAVYIFKPSGELVAGYPELFESRSKMGFPSACSADINKDLRTNLLNTVSSFSEITDGWEVVEENDGTCKNSDVSNKVTESTESDKIVTDKETSTIDQLETNLYGKKRDNNCDNLSRNDSSTVIQSVANSQPVLKCPTAVCCDSFGNVLLADFTGDCVHLLSPSGRYLGQVVTPANGVTCPNFVSLNADSSLLYVGQYGGEVGVFEYMSYVKKV